jgi:hypothetical protein
MPALGQILGYVPKSMSTHSQPEILMNPVSLDLSFAVPGVRWTAAVLVAFPLLAARAQVADTADHAVRIGITLDVAAASAASPIEAGPPRLMRDSTAHNHRVVHGAIIGGVIGAVAGAVLGASLPMGCISPVEGGDPHCSTTREHMEAALGFGLVAGTAGAVIGAAIAKLSTWF